MDKNSSWDGAVAGSYDAKWRRMAESGQNPHGEADFVSLYEPESVLDAGCGTGRVAIELAQRGSEVVGVDIDAQMLAEARSKAPELVWIQADLATLDLRDPSDPLRARLFDVVVMAGNIPLFVAQGARGAAVARSAAHVDRQGVLIAGYQLGRGVQITQFDAWAQAGGLEPEARSRSWDREPFTDDSAYVVSVYRRTSP